MDNLKLLYKLHCRTPSGILAARVLDAIARSFKARAAYYTKEEIEHFQSNITEIKSLRDIKNIINKSEYHLCRLILQGDYLDGWPAELFTHENYKRVMGPGGRNLYAAYVDGKYTVFFNPVSDTTKTLEQSPILKKIFGDKLRLDHENHMPRFVTKVTSTFAKEKFESDKHPRLKDGEFAPKNGGESSNKSIKKGHVKVSDTNDDKKRTMEDGSELPEHIKKLAIPPGWKNVTINPDPKATLQATGYDAKGRPQAIYSLEHSQRQAEAKFARVNELAKKYKGMFQENQKARKSSIDPIKDAADCTLLIMKAGLRPGSEEDTGAEKKAYGATNMLAKHVIVDNKGDVTLEFTGKKGVELKLPITDKEVAAMLIKRKNNADGDDKLIFPHTNEKRLLSHIHSLGGKAGFKTKDLRTHLANKIALNLIAKMEKPKDSKEYQRAVLKVGSEVAKKLGNTRTVALQSYINPVCFAEWKSGI